MQDLEEGCERPAVPGFLKVVVADLLNHPQELQRPIAPRAQGSTSIKRSSLPLIMRLA
jgi:hypothetical protein